jgi:hypothetical protein
MFCSNVKVFICSFIHLSKHLEEEYKSTPYLPWYVNIARTCGNNIFPGTFVFKDMLRS